MSSERRTIILRRLRRILRVALAVVGGTIGVVLALIVVALILRAGRELVLRQGLDIAQGALPGELTVTRAGWPRLGRLELDGILWIDGADTLASVDTLHVALDASDLLRRDLSIQQVLAAGIRADLPAIQARFPATVDTTATTTEPTAAPPSAPFFPRVGLLPPLPSIGLEQLALRDLTVVTAPGQTGRLEQLTAHFELRHGQQPSDGYLELSRLSWQAGPLTLAQLDTVSLVLDGAALQDRDLVVSQILVTDFRADLPAIQAHLPATTPATATAIAAEADTAASPPFAMPPLLREGGLPPLPSLAVEQLELRRATVLASANHEVQLDSLTAFVDLRHGRRPTFGAALRGRPLPDYGVAWRLEGQIDPDSLALDLAPLHLAQESDLPEPYALPLVGRLAIPHAYVDSTLAGRLDWPALELRGLAIAGDIGTFQLDAHLSGRNPGYLILETSLPRAPRELIASLAAAGADTLAPGLLDTLDARWHGDGAPGFALRIDLEPPAIGAPLVESRITIAGDLQLPPLAALAPVLPPQLVADDLGALIVDIDASYDGLARPPRFAARADLGGTTWLDAARIDAHGDTTRVQLDSLVVRVPGLAVVGAGTVSRDSVDLVVDLQIPDASLLERWNDPALDGIELSVDLHLDAAGAWPLPQIVLTADLSAVSPRLTVPGLSLTATVAADTVLMNLALPEGVQGTSPPLDRAAFTFAGAHTDSLRSLRGDLRLDVATPRSSLLLAGYLDARDLMTVPAATFAGDTLTVTLDDRDLNTPQPWQIAVDTADSSLTVTGFQLKGKLGELDLEAGATPDSLAASISLAIAVAFEALGAFVPPSMLVHLPTGSIAVDGDVEVAGTPRLPWADGRLQVMFRDNPDLANLRVETRLSLATGGEPPTAIDPDARRWQQHSARVDLSLIDADTVLTHIAALVPLPHADAQPDSVDLRLDATGMDLARLDPLLPRGFELQGRLDADTRIAGLMTAGEPEPNLGLAGGLVLTDLQLRAPDGSWISMAGDVTLDGTSLKPLIRGGLSIESGLIRIPEPPPTLLPATGEALLWQAAAPAPGSAKADSLAAAATDTTPSFLAGMIPDLVFTIHCPGSLWLRGQGLDIELSGDLAVHLRKGKPAIEGELKALQGTMKQLGRVFNLERGRVVFYADEDEINPELDLALGVKVGSYQITIALSGTANDPVLDFSSSPDLSDGDIISVLLFGKTSDELDEGQSGLMADRAAQVALAYGSVRLQESLARGLGVDVLTIAPKEGDTDKSSLTVGKYLNPKVMVRYEQVLAEDSAFFVHLDYNLTASQEWKLHTQISQGDASGIEIRWEKDW